MRKKRSELWLIVSCAIGGSVVNQALKHFGGRDAQLIGLGVAGVVLLILLLWWWWNIYQLKRYTALSRRIEERRPIE